MEEEDKGLMDNLRNGIFFMVTGKFNVMGKNKNFMGVAIQGAERTVDFIKALKENSVRDIILTEMTAPENVTITIQFGSDENNKFSFQLDDITDYKELRNKLDALFMKDPLMGILAKLEEHANDDTL